MTTAADVTAAAAAAATADAAAGCFSGVIAAARTCLGRRGSAGVYVFYQDRVPPPPPQK